MPKPLTANADRVAMRQALSALDDIANSPAMMGADDIDSLSTARELLADRLDLAFNDDTDRYTEKEKTK